MVRTIVCGAGVCFVATLAIVLPQQALAQADDSRVALVIGNDNYAKDPLKNAVNDARRVAETLIALNFRVVLKLNANLDDMNSATVEFARLLPDARAAVFFYAGHGLQRNQKNYLVPIGANITSDLEIKSKTFEASTVLDYMDESRVSNKILILDACRNNPFKGEFVLSETGLASMRTSSGTVIAFAAKPGAVAFDAGANEENGLYTKHLLREMVKPNLQSILMFENVSRAVQQESGGKQVPEALSSPSAGKRAFFFVEGAAPPLASLALGSDDAPQDGATLFLQVATLEAAPGWRLTGPGIEIATDLRVTGLASGSVAEFVADRAALASLFPRGIDIVLCAGGMIAALPRTTRIEVT